MIGKKLIAWLLVLLTLSASAESAASERASSSDHLRVSGAIAANSAWAISPGSAGILGLDGDDLADSGTTRWTDPGHSRGSFDGEQPALRVECPADVSLGSADAGTVHRAFLLRSGALGAFSTSLPPPLHR